MIEFIVGVALGYLACRIQYHYDGLRLIKEHGESIRQR